MPSLEVSLADPAWLVIALLAGLLARWIGLPPLVGYLGAGFALHALGAEGGQLLTEMADLGIWLLLFSIGLKLDLKLFTRPTVWIVGTSQLVLFTVALSAVALLAIMLGLGPLAGLDQSDALIIGFALSFSSTVFAVKVLEDLGASNSGHGRIAIGILILQDIFAVLFLVFSAGKVPSAWALALIPLLFVLRPVLNTLLDHVGHRELLMLFAVSAALGGAALFNLVGLKADLGALVMGLLLTTNPRAGELNRSMSSLKDLFLVAFFLSIGIDSLPSWGGVLVAALFLVVLPMKPLGYFWLFTRANLRARTSWQAGLDLTSYSEFGLVVVLAAGTAGWLPDDVLSMVAVLIAGSFVVGAPLAERGERLYRRWHTRLKSFESGTRLPGDEDLEVEGTEVIVFGMGRMGRRAYDAMERRFPGHVLGVDSDDSVIEGQMDSSRRIVAGDATDTDFWSRANDLVPTLQWVLLTMPSYEANRTAVSHLRDRGFDGKIAATSAHPDEVVDLKLAGVDFSFDIMAEAGAGFAGDLIRRIDEEEERTDT